MNDPVTAYASAVVAGEITTGKLVRLACQRHLNDLTRQDLHFDAQAAQRAIDFVQLLTHVEGEWAGQPLTLEPWQAFTVGAIFGWKRKDGLRRFRTAYHEVARKNGKSSLSAAIGLYLAFFDDEPGAQVYSAATARDQARLSHGVAVRMVKANPHLSRRIKVYRDNLNDPRTGSKFEPLASDANSLDGLNIHGAVVDEVHAHKSRALWDVLETACGARRQPLMYAITTAGWDKHSICWELHSYAEQVLNGTIPDDTFFAYIATLDEGDDWTSTNNWVKANPNLAVSVKVDDLERQCAKAKQVPAAQNTFKRLRMNVWTEQSERWVNVEDWDACEVAEVAPDQESECIAAIDLSSKLDITALVLYWPDSKELKPYFWIPRDNIRKRVERDKVPYDVWATLGLIETTEGNITDYAYIRKRCNELKDMYNIREIAIDPWNATHLMTLLQEDGFNVVEYRQTYSALSAPTKELESYIVAHTLRHEGHPVMRWMVSNASVEIDSNGNPKVSRKKSSEKIDGVICLCMCIGRAILQQQQYPCSLEFI